MQTTISKALFIQALRQLLGLALIGAALLLTGCASMQKMAWDSDTAQAIPTQKAVYLMTVTFKNLYCERCQPKLQHIQVIRDEGTSQQAAMHFPMDNQGIYTDAQTDQPPKYLIRLELEPGSSYTIRGMTAHGFAFPIIPVFFAPLHSPLKVDSAGIHYLGRVNASIRERKGDEFRAGAVLPLIDQAAGGASTGTFEMLITDLWDEDLALFRKRFPVLEQQPVTKAILPPFDRAKAQAWWEAN